MSGKPKMYRHLRGKLPAFTEEPTYQALVDERKQELLGTLDGEDANVNRLAALLVEKEYAKKALYERYGSSSTTDAEYEINLYRNAISQLFVAAATAQGAEEVRLSSGELVGLDDKAILTIADREKAIAFMLKNHPEMLSIEYSGLNAKQIEKLADWGAKNKVAIKVTINANTLKALGRDNAKNGKPVPEGMSLFLLTKAAVYGLGKNGSGDGEN